MYRFAAPHHLLQPYIDSYWFLRSEQPFPLEEKIFVDGKADIIFNFGCGYQRGAMNVPFSNLDAQRHRPVTIAQYGLIHLVGVRFKAGGLTAFLPMPMHEISDLHLDLPTAFGKSAQELENRLYDAALDTPQQVDLLDHFFLNRLALPPAYAWVFHTARRIENAMGNVQLAALSSEMGYSIRTVDRLFQHFFGMRPKFYARITRFHHALALLVRQPGLADVALTSGYYDQSHFSKDFAAFTGCTPRQYADYLTARSRTPAPNFVQFLQDQ
ncbi:MAG: helix-turn-helix domain-containing protein [Anaerolineae bacterium]|nr:helix-turn-helix domain-containing protein [Anaerolineae bacterium]